MTILEKIERLKEEFMLQDDWENRYRLIIERGKRLIPLTDQDRKDENLVKGCISKVWLVTEFNDGKIIFKADSDASITKGIISLLVEVYSGESPDDILKTKPDFLDELGIREALSMNRANGLTSMLKQINMYALAYKMKLQNK